MLKGTRDGILKKVQPTSIHGQVSWDVFFTDVGDPDGQTHVARVGPEAVMGHNMEPGDRIQVDTGRRRGARHAGRADILTDPVNDVNAKRAKLAKKGVSLPKHSLASSCARCGRSSDRPRVRRLTGPRRRLDRATAAIPSPLAERRVDAVQRARGA